MWRRVIGVVLVLVAASVARASAPDPNVRFERIATAALPKPAEVLVVTPPSYASSPGRRYPVLYFLHDGYVTHSPVSCHHSQAVWFAEWRRDFIQYLQRQGKPADVPAGWPLQDGVAPTATP